MADFTFNIALGRLRTYFENVKSASPANSAIIVMLLEASGLETDAVLKDKDDGAALVSGATNEQTTMGRKTLVAADLAAVAQDDTNDRLQLDGNDVTWTAASGNPLGKLVLLYDSDTTGGTDSGLIPLLAYDFVETPTGSDIVAVVNTNGFVRIT
jgi:hypothetical protein